MSLLLLTGLLALNAVISAWNAYITGRTWDAGARGWPRVVAWSGLIMAGSGFTYVFTALFAWIAYFFQRLSPEALEAVLSLGYLAIILPVLGSGIVITLHSWHIAWQRRRFRDMAVAGYNTFAQGHNMISAMREVPGAWEVVGQFFGGGKRSRSKEADKAAVLMLVLLALAAGVLTTYGIFAVGRRHARVSADREVRTARAKSPGFAR